MKYEIRYLTTYPYTDTVPVCHNQVCLALRKLPYQLLESFNLLVDPAMAEFSSWTDTFENRGDYFSIQDPHKGLSITAISALDVRSRKRLADSPDLKWTELVNTTIGHRSQPYLDAHQYTFASPYVSLSKEFADYALASFTPGRSFVEAAEDMTAQIDNDFEYDPRATTLSTSVDEVFGSRKGVFQDSRILKLPAYVQSAFRPDTSADTCEQICHRDSIGWSAPMLLTLGCRSSAVSQVGWISTPLTM